MLDVLTASDVRRQDAACEAAGISVGSLMDAAGFAVARATRAMLGITYGVRIVVVCGTGNNAGDGLVAASILRAWGAHVTVVTALGDQFTKEAAAAARRAFTGPIVPIDSIERETARADAVVDALFGVGLSRAPEGDAARAIDAINNAKAPVISIDVPSGMDADTGTFSGAAVRADGIVALSGLKPGLCFREDIAGWIEVADLGVPSDHRGGTALALEEADVAALLPTRGAEASKRGSGTLLIVAGSRAMPGAAALTTAAAVHSGAGLTTLAACDRVTQVALARTPEITTLPLPENSEGTLDEKAVEAILARAESFAAIALGPGISTHPAAIDAVRALTLGTTVPLVLDADGINAFAGDPHALRARRGFTLLTPHEGELARLMSVTVQQIRADRLSAARAAAAATGQAILLKGHGTIVCSSDGATFINLTGNRGLAQGGTGDVLTGIAASLLAQSSAAISSGMRVAVCAAAAWLHGRVADQAAAQVAPHPANASLLIDLLPRTIHSVFAGR